MSWRLARCLVVLRDEVNAYDPHRPKQADGTIGDAAHMQRKSSHNPDQYGVVRAFDITTTTWSGELAEHLRLMGQHGDLRILYVIFDRLIASGPHWTWRTYTGADPHTGHIHLSVSDDPRVYDLTGPWGWTGSHPTPPEVHPVTGSPRRSIVRIRDGRVVVHFADGGCWISPGAGSGPTAGKVAADFSVQGDCIAYGTTVVDAIPDADGVLVLLEDGHISGRFTAGDPGDAI